MLITKMTTFSHKTRLSMAWNSLILISTRASATISKTFLVWSTSEALQRRHPNVEPVASKVPKVPRILRHHQRTLAGIRNGIKESLQSKSALRIARATRNLPKEFRKRKSKGHRVNLQGWKQRRSPALHLTKTLNLAVLMTRTLPVDYTVFHLICLLLFTASVYLFESLQRRQIWAKIWFLFRNFFSFSVESFVMNSVRHSHPVPVEGSCSDVYRQSLFLFNRI